MQATNEAPAAASTEPALRVMVPTEPGFSAISREPPVTSSVLPDSVAVPVPS